MKKIIVSVLIIVLLITGCSAKKSTYNDGDYNSYVREGASSTPMEPQSEMAAGAYSEEYVPYEGAKIIKTLSYTLSTSEYDTDRQFLTQLSMELGGYIESMYEYASGAYTQKYRHLNMVLRIPSGRLGEFQERFEADRTLSSKNLSQADVTRTYVDIEARIKNLEARVERYRKMIDEANDMSDIIEIERALSEATYELESYESSKKGLDSQIDFSEVSINMAEVPDPLQVQAQVSFYKRLQESFIQGINGFIDGVQSLIFFVVSNIFGLLVFGLIVLGIIKFLKSKPLRRKKKIGSQKEESTNDESMEK